MAEALGGGSNARENKRLKLDLLHGFGSLGHLNFKDGVVFIEDDNVRIGFPMGKYFAIRHIEKPEMNFIKLRDNLENIVSICTSKNRKYIAVSEKIRGENYPQVSIYPVRGGANREREKLFRYTETKSTAFVHMAFAEDTRFLVMLTGYQDSQIVFLNTSTTKLMGSYTLSPGATRVSISPKDSHVVAVSGDKLMKILRVQENTFKPLAEITNLNMAQKFTEHVWFDEQKLLVANEFSTIYVIQNFQVIETINNIFGLSENDPKTCISAITVFSKGFFAGSDNGTISVWLRGDDVEHEYGQKKTFNFLRTRKPPDVSKKTNPEINKLDGVVNMDITPTEDMLAICFRNNDIATVPMSNLIPSTADSVDPLALKKHLEMEIQLDYIYNGFHNQSVTCIDICMQRPLIATCGKDSTIRIWNYHTFKCEMASVFSVLEDTKGEINPVLSLAFHPSGYYLAAGFIDKLRVFHVCAEELRLYRTLGIKNATCLKFSHGGHILAAAYPRPPNQSQYWINVYDAYTLEPLSAVPLKGPNQPVLDLLWTPRDESLISCGLDGGVYEWRVYDDFNKNDRVYNTCKFSSITYNQMTQTFLTCGTDGGNPIVKEIKMTDGTMVNIKDPKGVDYERDFPIEFGKLSQIKSIQGFYKTNGVVASTAQGQIKVFNGFFQGEAYDTISAHLGDVNKIISSPDGRYIFTVGEDHCVFIFQVSEMTETGQLVTKMGGNKDMEDTRENPHYMAVDEGLADIVLLSRKDIEKSRSEIKQLDMKVYTLETKLNYQTNDEKEKIRREQKNAEEKMHQTIASHEKRYEELQKQKIQLEKEYANLLKTMETNHLKAVEDLENLYEKKLAFENEKYLQLEQQLITERNENIRKIGDLEKRHETAIDKLETQYREEFSKTQRIFETTTQRADQIKSEYEEKLTQIEEEHEQEIEEHKAQHKKTVDELQTKIVKLNNENETFRREYRETNEENQNLLKHDKEKEDEIKMLTQKLKESHATINSLRAELEDRDETIKDKDKKIYEYKYKINDLQKSKHVLSYRTTEMRKSLEPKEAQIEKLKEELFKLEGEFENMLKTNQIQNEKLHNKEKKIEDLNHKLKQMTELSNKKEKLIQAMKMEIYNLASKDKKEWGAELQKLKYNFVDKDGLKQDGNDPRSTEEMVRQIQHLEKSIYQMNKSTEKMVKRREQDIYRKTMENSDLICDLNALRQEKKDLKSENYNLLKANESLVKEKKNMEEEKKILETVIEKLKRGGPEAAQTELNNYNKTLQKNQSTGHIPPLFKARQEMQQSQSKGKLVRGSMYDLKIQSEQNKNKLIETMGEIDLLNQRIMQQEQEIRVYREKLRRYGIEDGGQRINSAHLGQSQTLNQDGGNSSKKLESLNQQPQDRFQAMKTGLQVRTALKDIQDKEDKYKETI